jgi:hypothetical protein
LPAYKLPATAIRILFAEAVLIANSNGFNIFKLDTNIGIAIPKLVTIYKSFSPVVKSSFLKIEGRLANVSIAEAKFTILPVALVIESTILSTLNDCVKSLTFLSRFSASFAPSSSAFGSSCAFSPACSSRIFCSINNPLTYSTALMASSYS